MRPILDKESIDQIDTNAKENTNLSLTLAYSISSLYFSICYFYSFLVYLKLNGIETSNNPIMKEIERV